MASEQNAVDVIIADYWNNHTDESYFGETYWLANPIINHRYQIKAAGGRSYDSWVNFTVEHFLGVRAPVGKILSIGSGDGALERHLASINAAKRIEGVDLAPKRVEIAQKAASENNMQDTISYTTKNVESSALPKAAYDAIYFNSSLHHMADVDGILSSCSAAMKKDAYIFINEYIGPNRFNFSAREKEVMTSVFHTIPEKYRVSQAEHDKGTIRTHLGFPSPTEVESVDPSEAVHSEEIVGAVHRHFDVVEFNYTGGTLMQFMLNGIAGNFRHDDPVSRNILDLIFKIEDTLVESGDLTPHFAMIVAKLPA